MVHNTEYKTSRHNLPLSSELRVPIPTYAPTPYAAKSRQMQAAIVSGDAPIVYIDRYIPTILYIHSLIHQCHCSVLAHSPRGDKGKKLVHRYL